jgi:segregation and condensation protein A
MKPELDSFTLDVFEGPLDFLLHLIQKSEIDIYSVQIQNIMDQFTERFDKELCVDTGAEFIATASSLLLLKSKMLLPKHEQVSNPEDEQLDPRFEIIHKLIEYCRFKEAAKELAERERVQGAFYYRGSDIPEIKKPLGVEHLTLDDLASLFRQIVAKAQHQKGTIHEEEWRVSDKIKLIRQLLKEPRKIGFEILFSPERSRTELIVTFLAVLELMKMGEIKVVRDVATQQVMITCE